MKLVYIDNNTVREIPTDDPNGNIKTLADIEKYYNAEFASHCVEAPNEVQQQWVYDPETGGFSPPPAPEPPDPEQRYKELVVQYIRERYSDNDEFAMTTLAVAAIENGTELPPEYAEYRAYVEDCKERAHREVYGDG